MTKFGELPPSGSVNQRLREILDGGYNYWTIRPLSSYQSRTALRKKIEIRLRMKNYGVSPYAVKAGKRDEAHEALLAAYRLITDEEIAEYKAKQERLEPSTGGFVAKLSDGRTRRFYGGDRRMMDWAAGEIEGKPGMRAEFFHHESMAGGKSAYSKQPFEAIETNESGRVLRADVPPLPPFKPNATGGRGRPVAFRCRGCGKTYKRKPIRCGGCGRK